jgi:hypothetical protein
LLKPELLRAIADCGFEHPSEGISSCSWKWCDRCVLGWIPINQLS